MVRTATVYEYCGVQQGLLPLLEAASQRQGGGKPEGGSFFYQVLHEAEVRAVLKQGGVVFQDWNAGPEARRSTTTIQLPNGRKLLLQPAQGFWG
jgi:hypothetical protein